MKRLKEGNYSGCNKVIALGQTQRIFVHSQIMNKKRNASKISRRQSKENTKKNAPTHSSLLSKVATSKKGAVTTQTLRGRYDMLIKNLFIKIDFDCSGFITGTKIAYYKELPERIFYFFGGVFQKVKQLGAVTLKMFASLCDEAFVKAKINDLQEILCQDHETNKRCNGLSQSGIKIQIKLNRDNSDHNRCKTDYTCKQTSDGQTPQQFTTTKLDKFSRVQTKYSLKLRSQPSEKQTYYKSYSKLKHYHESPTKKLNFSYRQSTSIIDQSVSFQSERVKKLAQKLDRQIEQSQYRLFRNKFIL